MRKHRKRILGIAASAALIVSLGCSGANSSDDHANHSHDHGDHDHDHAAGPDDSNQTSSDSETGTAAAKPYPLEVCIVSDGKLGSMGKPVVRVHEGQEVKFCCDSCIPDFEKEPTKFLTKLAK